MSAPTPTHGRYRAARPGGPRLPPGRRRRSASRAVGSLGPRRSCVPRWPSQRSRPRRLCRGAQLDLGDGAIRTIGGIGHPVKPRNAISARTDLRLCNARAIRGADDHRLVLADRIEPVLVVDGEAGRDLAWGERTTVHHGQARGVDGRELIDVLQVDVNPAALADLSELGLGAQREGGEQLVPPRIHHAHVVRFTVERQDTTTSRFVDDRVRVLSDLDRRQGGERDQVEYGDRIVFAITGEATTQVARDRDAVDAAGVCDGADLLVGRDIDDLGLQVVRDVEPVRRAVDRQVVPTRIAAERDLVDDLIDRCSLGQADRAGEHQHWNQVVQRQCHVGEPFK